MNFEQFKQQPHIINLINQFSTELYYVKNGRYKNIENIEKVIVDIKITIGQDTAKLEAKKYDFVKLETITFEREHLEKPQLKQAEQIEKNIELYDIQKVEKVEYLPIENYIIEPETNIYEEFLLELYNQQKNLKTGETIELDYNIILSENDIKFNLINMALKSISEMPVLEMPTVKTEIIEPESKSNLIFKSEIDEKNFYSLIDSLKYSCVYNIDDDNHLNIIKNNLLNIYYLKNNFEEKIIESDISYNFNSESLYNYFINKLKNYSSFYPFFNKNKQLIIDTIIKNTTYDTEHDEKERRRQITELRKSNYERYKELVCDGTIKTSEREREKIIQKQKRKEEKRNKQIEERLKKYETENPELIPVSETAEETIDF